MGGRWACGRVGFAASDKTCNKNRTSWWEDVGHLISSERKRSPAILNHCTRWRLFHNGTSR